MTLDSILRRLRLVREQTELIVEQRQLMRDMAAEYRRLHLEYTREIQGLVSAWILNLEQPELDLRDELHALNTALDEKIAVMEEHVV